MKVELLRRVRRHFCHELAPTHTARHNMRAWARAVRLLGDKWLLARPVEKRT